MYFAFSKRKLCKGEIFGCRDFDISKLLESKYALLRKCVYVCYKFVCAITGKRKESQILQVYKVYAGAMQVHF